MDPRSARPGSPTDPPLPGGDLVWPPVGAPEADLPIGAVVHPGLCPPLSPSLPRLPYSPAPLRPTPLYVFPYSFPTLSAPAGPCTLTPSANSAFSPYSRRPISPPPSYTIPPLDLSPSFQYFPLSYTPNSPSFTSPSPSPSPSPPPSPTPAPSPSPPPSPPPPAYPTIGQLLYLPDPPLLWSPIASPPSSPSLSPSPSPAPSPSPPPSPAPPARKRRREDDDAEAGAKRRRRRNF